MNDATTSLALVGLGNPGKKYEQTRHNFGFLLIDQLAKLLGASLEKSTRFKGEVGKTEINGRKLFFLKPLTYMNLSGESVRALLSYYQIPAGQLLAVTDDSDLPFGTLRFREKGSSGGHNGLKDIEACLGTREYPRLRLGIGKPSFGHLDAYVIGRFTDEEQKALPEILKYGEEVVKLWIDEGPERAATHAGIFHLKEQKME